MSSFHKGGECQVSQVVSTATTTLSNETEQQISRINGCDLHVPIDTQANTLEHTTSKRRRTKKDHRHRKEHIKRRSREDNDDERPTSSDSSSSFSSREKYSQKRHKRKKRSRSRHKRHTDKHSKGRSCTNKSSESNTASTHDKTTQEENNTIQLLRKKRLEREAAESQRANRILNKDSSLWMGDRDRGYQDQWNPLLSRK